MKKYLSLALVAIAIITACLCFVSCKSEETPMEVILEEIDKISFKDKTVVYNGKPKNITVTTRLQYNRLPSGIKVRYEGNGNTEVGEYEVKAIFSKNGVEIPEATKTAKLKITKATYDITEGLETFKDTTVYYNGQTQTVKVNEKRLPEGVSVTYDLHGVDPKVAGQYQITAKFTHTNTQNYEPIPDETVTLTIEKKLFETTEFSFNRTYTVFDGSKKSVEITGTLPEGLMVRYEGNEVMSVGTHTVRAIFYTKDPNCTKEGCADNPHCCEDPNYQAPAPMATTLEIINEDYTTAEGLTFGEVKDSNKNVIGYSVKSYNGNATYLIIPSTHNGLPVTEISARAFRNDTTFIYVHMPDSITTIGANAFNGCSNLVELHLSASLTSIGTNVFSGCAKLVSITLPDSITEIPNNCFNGCTSLKTVNIGSNVTSIGNSAFANCSELKKIYIPKTVTAIAKTSTKLSQSPFSGVAENFMIVLESNKLSSEFGTYWSNITETSKALVIYDQSYDNYVINSEGFRTASLTDALAGSITLGITPLVGFDTNIFTYTAYANINYGYPIVSAKAASPAALVAIEQATVENGGVATITITSADGAAVKVYTVNFTTIGEFTVTSEIVNKNNADGIVTYVIDDGYEDTANNAKDLLLKYSYLNLSFAVWTKDFATLTEQDDADGGKSYVMEDGKYVYTVNQNKVNFWNGILDGVDGRAEIVVHSHTHQPWGMNDDGGEYKYVDNNGNVQTKTTPKGSTSKEYYGAKQIISELFPQMKNVAFITPGIGVKTSNQTTPGGELIPTYKTYADQVLRECINSGVFLGARGTFIPNGDYSNYIVTKDTINNMSVRMNLPGLAVKDYDDVSLWTNYIDAAAAAGGWAMFCIHEIDSDPSNRNWWISEEKADQLFGYTADKNIWVANFSDAITYLIEWASAKVDANYDSATNKVSVSITDREDNNEIFNTPLTVKVTLPIMWEAAKCGDKNLEIHVDNDGNKYVYVDVVPDKGAVYLEMIAD